jgi:hypothetical protein
LEAPDKPLSETAITDAPKARAFSASELVQCGVCGRANSPLRANCLYCGSSLGMTGLNAVAAAPVQNVNESADVGFHLVAVPPMRLDLAAINEIAEFLQIKPSDLQSLLTHLEAAPVFMESSEHQARTLAEKLEEHGLNTEIISDSQLGIGEASRPISALKIDDDKILGSIGRSEQVVDALWANVTLIVVGRLYFATKEIDQKQNRSQHVMDEREMLTDEAVLDLYVADNGQGWRIRAASFDFSCLGERKQLTAFANFTALTELLREKACVAAFDDAYIGLRAALDAVWPTEPMATAKEKRRSGFRAFDSSVTSIDNALQFTRYSRLLRYLQALKSEDHAA